MFVHESGVGYTVYLQNNKYANQVIEERNDPNKSISAEESKTLDDYLNKIVDSIPELKASVEAGQGIGFVILPESTSSTLKDAVSQTSTKMLDEGTDQNILKGVLGIVKENYSMDIEYGTGMSGVAHIKNDTVSYDMDALNGVLSKFKDIYSSNTELSNGLNKFSQYLNEIYGMLKDVANPTGSDTATTASINNTKNDLVDTLIQEMDKSEEDETPGADQLTKKLYKNYMKSLKSALTGGLLQQSS